jgi:hypothetical protein
VFLERAYQRREAVIGEKGRGGGSPRYLVYLASDDDLDDVALGVFLELEPARDSSE